MGTHGASARPRALPPARRAAKSTKVDSKSKTQLRLDLLDLTDWPVARRLFAVIVAALLMGLIFGGLRVAAAEGSASQLGRTQQLAQLGAQLNTVVDDLQTERDATLIALITGNTKDARALQQLQAKTNSDLGPVRPELQQIVNGGFPAAIATDAGAVSTALSVNNMKQLHGLLGTALPGDVIVSADYESVINEILTLQKQVSLGNTDQSLNNDVQTLNALSQAKDLVSQQLAQLDQSLSTPANSVFAQSGMLSFTTESKLQVDYDEEFNDEAAFQSTATPAENAMYDSLLGPQAAKLDGENLSNNIEQAFFAVASGQPNEPNGDKTAVTGTVTGPSGNPTSGILYPQFIQNELLDPLANNPVTAKQDKIATIAQLKAAWDKGISAKLKAMQATEQFVAGNIVTRATQLQQAAQQSALVYIIITVAVLLIVLGLALLVARSLVLPLRSLRAGALDIASVQLPERVRLLSDSPESAASMEVAPIDVTSQDEIGQVARAFDQVHSEAVRLAGEQALLRSSFNAMFVNLSRRSQTLIERLARMIDTLEQKEDDPDRLGSLFSMDHLVTRMRRNSENLLLLAGHENPRKWSDSVPLADIARAATSEIEQYNRVVLNIPPGVAVLGPAVSDVVHLLAELIENATIFSSKDTQVQVSMQELTSGGVLVEVLDKGIGVSDARLADMNWRLDNPPTIDVSVSRHMGLFAVARLAERHRVRVRLRPAPPKGLSALVWLPDSVIERGRLGAGSTSSWSAAQPVGAQARAGGGDAVALTAAGGGSVGLATDYADGNGNGYGYGNGTGNGNGYGNGSSFGNGNGNGFGSIGHGNGGAPAEGRTAKGWFRGGQDAPDQAMSGAGSGMDGQNGDFFSEPPLAGDQTASGLPVRVPRANMPPGTGPSTPPDSQGSGLPARSAGADGASGGPAGNAQANADGGGKGLPKRSPDQARSRLSGFQRGTRRAEAQGGSGGQAPRAGEGTDR